MSTFQLLGREVPDDRFAKEVEVLVPVELDLDTIRDLNPEFLGVAPARSCQSSGLTGEFSDNLVVNELVGRPLRHPPQHPAQKRRARTAQHRDERQFLHVRCLVSAVLRAANAFVKKALHRRPGKGLALRRDGARSGSTLVGSSLSSRISCAGLNFNSNRSFDRSFIRSVSFMRLF